MEDHFPGRLEAIVDLVPEVHGFQGAEGCQEFIRLAAALDLTQRLVRVDDLKSVK
ncbi:hypothetical protein D3C80_2101300 [compost metagenome]